MLPKSFNAKPDSITCDPGDASFYNNPYPVYREMQKFENGFNWDNYKLFCFARHDQVSRLLRDRRFGRILPETDLFANAPQHLKPFYRFEANSLLEMEPPAHTRLRKHVNRAFVSRNIEALRPEIFELTNQLINDFEQQGPINLLTEFAEIIPVNVIARLIGIPTSMSQQLLTWSHAMVAMYQHNRSKKIEDKAVAATQDFSNYINEIIAEKAKNPDDDLISQLVGNEERMSDDELVTTCMLLLNAGHEATVHAIGNGVKFLLENHEDTNGLLGNEKDIPAICEELLRLDPPLHMFTRIVLQDLEFDGRHLKRGDEVGLLIAAANHDAGKYPEPEKFVQDRPGISGQTGFGAGVHFCIGAPLARMEMQIALPILFKRLPGLKLVEPPQYADRYHFHGLEKLMVSW